MLRTILSTQWCLPSSCSTQHSHSSLVMHLILNTMYQMASCATSRISWLSSLKSTIRRTFAEVVSNDLWQKPLITLSPASTMLIGLAQISWRRVNAESYKHSWSLPRTRMSLGMEGRTPQYKLHSHFSIYFVKRR